MSTWTFIPPGKDIAGNFEQNVCYQQSRAGKYQSPAFSNCCIYKLHGPSSDLHMISTGPPRRVHGGELVLWQGEHNSLMVGSHAKFTCYRTDCARCGWARPETFTTTEYAKRLAANRFCQISYAKGADSELAAGIEVVPETEQ